MNWFDDDRQEILDFETLVVRVRLYDELCTEEHADRTHADETYGRYNEALTYRKNEALKTAKKAFDEYIDDRIDMILRKWQTANEWNRP